MPVDTKEIIIEVSQKLVEERKNSKITVSDIVKRCGITRRTFYYYFCDIYDLFEIVVERELESLFLDSASMMDFKEILKAFFDFMFKHREP